MTVFLIAYILAAPGIWWYIKMKYDSLGDDWGIIAFWLIVLPVEIYYHEKIHY